MKTMPSLNKPIILFDIDYTLFNTALFKQSNRRQFELYPEVMDVLTNLSRIAILGIFSEGNQELQNKKLEETRIDHFFSKDHIHIMPLKQEVKEISDKYHDARIFLVDDKLLALRLMKKALANIKTIWIKRGEYAKKISSLPDFTPDASLDNLSGLIPLVINK